MIDILIINSENQSKIYQNLHNEHTAIEPPVWSGLIATYVRNKGYSVKIYDTATVPFSIEFIRSNPCKLIVIPVYGHQPSSSTQNMPFAYSIINLIKSDNLCSDTKILILGNHASALPERTLMESHADFLAIGEGVKTICDVISGVDYKKCRGLLTYDGENFVYGTSAFNLTPDELNTDMNIVAWDLFDMSKYRAHNWHCFGFTNPRTPYASIYTSLGCQFKCDFCMIHTIFNEHKMRLWSVENIINQIDVLYNVYGVKNIKIADEMFMMYKNQVHELCDALIQKNYENLNMWAYARIDTIRDDYLPKLVKAGIRWLALGIESGNDDVRGMSNKNINTSNILRVVRKLQEFGIMIQANYMFGLPNDTMQSMRETLDLAKELNTEMANFFCVMAYPGSELYNHAILNNLSLPQSWEDYSQHSYGTYPLSNGNLTSSEILKFRDCAFNEYFTNPKYLEMMKNKFGNDTVLYISKMVSTQLTRKLYTK